MIIRRAHINDLETLIMFQKEMAMESENLVLEEADIRTGVIKVLQDPSRGFYHVTENEGRIIACHMITIEWSDWRNGSIYWIQSLYVLPEYRKQGVFRMMYRHLQDMVKGDKGVKGIRLYVDRANTVAQKTYEALEMDGNHYKVYEWMDDYI